MKVQDENIFSPILRNSDVVILDGGLATELEREGHDLRHPFWSGRFLSENPEAIWQVHQQYLEAGTDIITTASYQISFEGGKVIGLDTNQVADLLRLSVTVANDAVDVFWEKNNNSPRPMVAASMGPYGAYLCDGSEYTGAYDVSKRKIREFHRRRWEVMTDTPACLLGFETIPNIYEAEVIRRLAEEYSHKPFWISFCCRDKNKISDGHALTEVIKMFSDLEQVCAVGINCTAPTLINPLIACARNGAPNQQIIVYPNSGETYDASGRGWLEGSRSGLLQRYADHWKEAGAQIIGGCCRTSPSDIRALKEIIR